MVYIPVAYIPVLHGLSALIWALKQTPMKATPEDQLACKISFLQITNTRPISYTRMITKIKASAKTNFKGTSKRQKTQQ